MKTENIFSLLNLKFLFQLFEANIDDNTVAVAYLPYQLIARYIRINPQRWNRFISLRAELYGCRFGE